jgi:predicted transcriptional regulator
MRRKEDVKTLEKKAEAAAGNSDLMQYASEIVVAYVSHNQVLLVDLPTIIKNLYAALADLSGAAAGRGQGTLTPAISIKRSIGDDYIICLEDGKKLKMLKRYLRSHFNLTPKEYRAKWSLPSDYPMVAPAYARQRSTLAKKIGLGRAPGGAHRGRRRKAS